MSEGITPAIAAGLIHAPPILFLDEPTTGIDVASARQIRQLLARLRTAGTTIFLTTHYIEEAESLCDRIAFIVQGRIVRIDTLANLLRDFQGRHTVQFALEGGQPELVQRARAVFPDLEWEPISGVSLRVHASREVELSPFIRFFEEQQVSVTEAKKIQPSLEEVFVRVTGIELSAMQREQGGKGR
jgi:ABC-2 type transport system ATP-binding protein